MKRALLLIPALLALAACTAETQIGDFIARQPDPNLVFSEDFERGLDKWTQNAGTWTTGSPAPNGVALISPTGASATTFNLTTVNDIDLVNRSNCELTYDERHAFSGTAGVWAQILHAGNVVSEFKNTAGTGAISSATQFITRKVILTPGTKGKLTILTGIATSTAADLRIDNISVRCGKTFPAAVNNTLETFESGGTNWTLGSWAVTAGVGQAGSAAAKITCVNNCTAAASYLPNISLQNRSGCVLKYFYDLNGSTVSTQDCIGVYWNSLQIRAHCSNVTPSAVVTHPLTAFEGVAVNQLYYTCNSSTGNTAVCVIDNVTVECQQ